LTPIHPPSGRLLRSFTANSEACEAMDHFNPEFARDPEVSVLAGRRKISNLTARLVVRILSVVSVLLSLSLAVVSILLSLVVNYIVLSCQTCFSFTCRKLYCRFDVVYDYSCIFCLFWRLPSR
jgi:hypothetical protein